MQPTSPRVNPPFPHGTGWRFFCFPRRLREDGSGGGAFASALSGEVCASLPRWRGGGGTWGVGTWDDEKRPTAKAPKTNMGTLKGKFILELSSFRGDVLISNEDLICFKQLVV